jgi:hypothetical protein
MCEVDRAFDDERVGDVAGRLKRPAESQGASIVKRQKQWLCRYVGGAREQSWRPMVEHRVSPKRWMAALDNQLNCSALPTGLATFAPSASREAPWDNWRQWPHLTISLDLGSDGLAQACSVPALVMGLRVN